MKKLAVIGLMVLGSALGADYVLEYEMQDGVQTYMYHSDTKAKMLTRSDGESSGVYKIGKKSYIVGGDGTVMDVDEMKKMAAGFSFGEGVPQEEERGGTPKVTRTGKSINLAGIRGEVWRLSGTEDGLSYSSEVIVTKDKRVVKTIRAVSSAWGNSMDGGLEIQKGYVIIKAEGMKLKSFHEKSVDAKEYALPDGTHKAEFPDGKMLGERLSDACYESVCCGNTAGESKYLGNALTSSYKSYTLVGSGVCDSLGLSSVFGVNSIEGALYKKGSDTVQLTLALDDKDGGVVHKAKMNLDAGQAVVIESIKEYEEYSRDGLTHYYGILMPMNQETLDIIVNENTILTVTRRVKGSNVSLKSFAQSIDLSALKSSVESAPQEKNEVNIDTDSAVNLLKSFF